MPRYAAIDIGSNSIRMAAAEVVPGSGCAMLASERVVTRLGESVFRNGVLAQERAGADLHGAGAHGAAISKLDVVGVRAVATSAVRDARNQAEFIERASQAIGTPVEIISGREEARLIHLGVQARWPHPGRRLLILDIGGGSAELIAERRRPTARLILEAAGRRAAARDVSAQRSAAAATSCTRCTSISRRNWRASAKRFGNTNWDRVIATSATASAVVCAVNRVPRSKRDQADRMRASDSRGAPPI